MEIIDNFLVVAGEKGISKFLLSSSRDTFGLDCHEMDDSESIKLVA